MLLQILDVMLLPVVISIVAVCFLLRKNKTEYISETGKSIERHNEIVMKMAQD